MLTLRRTSPSDEEGPGPPGREATSSDGAVLVDTPAKVNLFLEVLARRPDGYHEIATLMTAVDLYDRLELRSDPSEVVRLECDDPALSVGPDNLVARAAEALRVQAGRPLGARIRLSKRIPMAAGLAGGSSDAAATLQGLNRLWRLGMTKADLIEVASTLGSDVAFFFDLPAAWCTGRGEVVAPVPAGRPLDLVLVSPPVGVSTAAAYRGVTVPAEPRDGSAARAALAAGDVEALGRALFNRLEGPAMDLCPPIAELRRGLESLGAAGVLMSGSGSSLFALCRDRAEAIRVARDLHGGSLSVTEGTRAFVVRSCV